MALTLTLLLGTLIAAAALASALLPARTAVRAGCALNLVQLHTVAVLGIYPSLALLAWLAPWRSAFGSGLWRWPWMQALLALAVAQAASLAWSPAPMLMSATRPASSWSPPRTPASAGWAGPDAGHAGARPAARPTTR